MYFITINFYYIQYTNVVLFCVLFNTVDTVALPIKLL